MRVTCHQPIHERDSMIPIDNTPGKRYLIRNVIYHGKTLHMQLVEFLNDGTMKVTPFIKETAATVFVDAAVNLDF